jgi:hypothetical protein
MSFESCGLIPKDMPPITFLPGVNEESFDLEELKILYEIHSEEKKQMIAFHQSRYIASLEEKAEVEATSRSSSRRHDDGNKEDLKINTRSKKRERESDNQENDDLPDDKSTTADSLWSSFECRKKLKAKEKELSSSSAARDFIQECNEYQEYLSSFSSSSDDSR